MRKLVAFLIEEMGTPIDEMIFHFVTKKQIGKIHKDFFDDPSPTDCITFPIGRVGEAFICPEVAMEYDPKHPYDEVTLYIVHCLLHLTGYDDIAPKDRRIMRQQEAKWMKVLSQKKISMV